METAEAVYERFDSFSTSVGASAADVAVIALTTALFLWFTLRYGKGRTVALILSLYVALLGYTQFPYTQDLVAYFTNTDLQVLMLRTAVFTALVIVVYLIIHHLVHADVASKAATRWFEALLLGAATTALLLAFSYHVLPLDTAYDFSNVIDRLFAPAQFFWWLVAPLAVLLVVARR